MVTVAPESSVSSLPSAFRAIRRDPGLTLLIVMTGLLVVMALVPGLIAPHDPQEIRPTQALASPSREFWLGTDNLGRDLFSRIVYGARVELLVAIGGMLGAAIPGIPLGLVAGFRGGWVDTVLMRSFDGILAFPTILLAIMFVATFGASALNIVIVVGVSFLPLFARLARASTLVLRNTDFVLASVAMGAGSTRVMFRVILPNAVVPLTVLGSLTVSFAFLIEASMSYLGFGVQPPEPSWGVMLRDAQTYMRTAPWFVLAPGLAITFAVLAFNQLGDRLRDLADPRLRHL